MTTINSFFRKSPTVSKSKRHTVNPKLPKNITQYQSGDVTYLQLHVRRNNRVRKVSKRKAPGVLAMLVAWRDEFIQRESKPVKVQIKTHTRNQPKKYKKS